MSTPVLHYVHDPLCGWCYAAEPLVEAAVAGGIPVMLHGGGLWDQPIHAPDAKRRMMRSTDDRIAELTGQIFGSAYLDGLLVDPVTIWHSRPTIAAILAADQLRSGQGLAMMSAIQRAHYVDGRRVVQDQVLTDIAGSIGLDATAFAAALQDVAVDQHIQQTRRLMENMRFMAFHRFLYKLVRRTDACRTRCCMASRIAFWLRCRRRLSRETAVFLGGTGFRLQCSRNVRFGAIR